MEVTLFWKAVFADVIKPRTSRWKQPRFRVVSKSSWCPYQRKKRESCDTGVPGKKAMWGWRQRLELRSHKPSSPFSHQELGEETGFSPCDFIGNAAVPTPWFQTPGLQNCERKHFMCFKSPSVCNLFRQPWETNINWIPLPSCLSGVLQSLWATPISPGSVPFSVLLWFYPLLFLQT